jgi:hypothetical protein
MNELIQLLIDFKNSDSATLLEKLQSMEAELNLDCSNANINDDWCKTANKCRSKIDTICQGIDKAKKVLEIENNIKVFAASLENTNKVLNLVDEYLVLYPQKYKFSDDIYQLLNKLYDKINAQCFNAHNSEFWDFRKRLADHLLTIERHNITINCDNLAIQTTQLKRVTDELKITVQQLKKTSAGLQSLAQVIAILEKILAFAAIFL